MVIVNELLVTQMLAAMVEAHAQLSKCVFKLMVVLHTKNARKVTSTHGLPCPES